MIKYYLDARSGVVPYLQIVQQIKRALLLRQLKPGDQLPTVREAVAMLAINPNTVLKAYRELEREGLVASRPGTGTFIQRSLGEVSTATLALLRRKMSRWLDEARAAGLDDESIQALFYSVMQAAREASDEERRLG